MEDRFFLDIALFYNVYDHLRTGEPAFDQSFRVEGPGAGYMVLPVIPDNRMKGETYGIELAAEWQISKWWRVHPAYTFLRMDLELVSGSQDSYSLSAEGESPEHQFSLRSSMDLPMNLELDLWFRCVDKLPAQDLAGYVTMDARLAWQFKEFMEIAVVGRNLFDAHHPEFRPEFQDIAHAEVQRGIYGKVIWRF
jgi:iron complex outermembrane receptor protein